MKSVFYKGLIIDRQHLSANERIVYSFLVYSAICDSEDSWDKETGDFDDIELMERDDIHLPFAYFDDRMRFCYGNKIAKVTGVSQPSVSRAVNKLISKNLVNVYNQTVKHKGIYEYGYFILELESGLSGELLIFYSWLKDIIGDNAYIFANREKLAEMYGVAMKDVRDYLRRLKLAGKITRDENRRLIIN